MVPARGKLTVQEVQTPVYYVLDDTVHTYPTNALKAETYRNHQEETRLLITKYGSDGRTPLAGVTFDVYFAKARVSYNAALASGYAPEILEGQSKRYTTDAKGEIRIANLDQGEYVISEVKTVPGYTLLPDVITVTVPIGMTKQEGNAYGNVDWSKSKEDPYSNRFLFFEDRYEIKNGVEFQMPLTGASGTWKFGFVGVGMLFVFGLGYVIFTYRRKKSM